nr:phosphatidylinositol N-acetylglucosaminyltransferase subunit P-like [Tanacetum cinerariifolium]
MEYQHTFNSPRPNLNYSRNRGATFSILEADNKASGVDVLGEQCPFPSKVYRFVRATQLLLLQLPQSTTVRYWALALSCYVIVTVATIFVFYIGLNFMPTPPQTSLNSIFDENSKDPVFPDPTLEEDDRPIEPYSDICINQINELMFKDWK